MIWTFHRRRLKIFAILIAILLLGRWLFNLSVDYAIANYFHHKLNPNPQTHLAYDISDIDVHWLKRKIDINTIKVEVDHTDENLDTTNYRIIIPQLSIDLLSTRDLIFRRILNIEEVKLDYPQIHIFLPLVQDSVILRDEIGDLQQKTLQFLQKLNLQHFEIRHGKVLWSVDGIQIPRYTLTDISVKMSDINIIPDSLSREGMTQLLLTDHMEVTLNNDSLLLPDNNHKLHFKRLHISSKEKLVLIDSLQLYSTQTQEISSSQKDNNVQMPWLYLKGVDFLSLYLDNDLLIDTVMVGDTDLHIMLDDQTLSLFQSEENMPKHQLDSIRIHHVQIIPSAITVNQKSKSLTNTFKVDSASLMLDNVTHTSKEDTEVEWNVDNLQLQLSNYQAKLEKLHYAFGFEKLNWSILDKTFGLEGVRVFPLEDSMTLAAPMPLKYLEIPSFTIKDIKFKDFLLHQQLSGGSIEINSPNVGIQLSKDNNTKTQEKPDISALLAQFFQSFRLETVNLNNGNVALYQEQEEPLLKLENIAINGYDWEMKEDDSFQENFALLASIEKGQFNHSRLRANFTDATYSNQDDLFAVQQSVIQPTTSEAGIEGFIKLSKLRLDGVLSFTENRQLNRAEIGSIEANITLTDNTNRSHLSPSPAEAAESFIIRELQIDHLNAELAKTGLGTFALSDGEADIKMLALGGTNPTFDFALSMIKIGESKVNSPSFSSQIDSVRFVKNNVDVFNIRANSDTTAETRWNFNLPQIRFSHLELPDELHTGYRIGKVALYQPDGEVSLSSNQAKPVKENDNSTIKSKPSFELRLDTIEIADAQWELEQSKSNNTEIWSSESTTIRAYAIQYPLDISSLYTKDIMLTVHDLLHNSESRNLTIEKLRFESDNPSLQLLNIHFDSFLSSKSTASSHLKADIPEIFIKADNISSWESEQALSITDLIVNKPQIHLIQGASQQVPPKQKEAQQKSELPLSSILIKQLVLKDASFGMQAQDDKVSLQLKGMNFRYQDFSWDSNEQLAPETLVQAGKWNFDIGFALGRFSSPQQIAEIYGLNASQASSNLGWDSLSFSPSVGPLAFSAFLTHQKSWLSINTGEGEVTGLDWQRLSKSELHAQKITIHEPQLQVFRDQRLPFPENHYPPVLHKMLVDLSHPVSIDSIELTNGSVDASVQPETGEKVGRIYFSNIESYLSNITNLPEEIQQDDILRMTTYAQLQNAGLLRADVDFALNNPNYPFFMDVQMGKMDLRELNSLVEPVASVRINKGKMRKMDFRAIGNLDFAYGSMDFMYRKLELSLLSKNDHEHQGLGLALESFLANKLILKSNNDYPFAHRQGRVFVERDETRSMFNYWGKIAISGILSSAGVKSNRKALHQQFEHRKKQLENSSVQKTTFSDSLKLEED